MPGTIQVSVLGFKGLHSSSASSHISVKVSMGTREYQTWDKGGFSFPLTTLRDNLIITLEDAEGNKISHTGVETRLVVEKGVWDDIFSLEGGGHVHMKLQFILSEEERQRIRIMRESALKKKHELCNSGHGNPKSASVGCNEVSVDSKRLFLDLLSSPCSQDSQESFFQSGMLANEAKLNVDNRYGSYFIQKQQKTNERDENEGNTSAKSMPEALNVHLTKLCHHDSVPSELEKANNSKKKRPARKAHSNVRKMISAFEGRLNQDVKPSIKPPPQRKIIGMDPFLENSHLNEVETEKVTLGRINNKEFEQIKISAKERVETIDFVKPKYGAESSEQTEQLKESTAACYQTEKYILGSQSRFTVKQKESDEKEEKKYSKDFGRASTIEKAAFSGRILDKHSTGNQSWSLFSQKQHFSRSLVTKEGGEEIFRKDPREAERNSFEKLKSMAIWGDEHCYIGSSGLWIFPGETKCLCITTGGKQIMDLMGCFWDETNTQQRKLSEEVNTDAGTTVKANEDGQTSKRLRPKVKNSMDPVGQVIKVVIMMSFATLVLLTRQRR